MSDFTTNEIEMLMEAGFVAGWLGDVAEGDEVALVQSSGYGDAEVRKLRQLRARVGEQETTPK